MKGVNAILTFIKVHIKIKKNIQQMEI